ncbi:serine protease grass-like isoform X2 [Ochlerotatus camptorhynchus]|uniref:serine protease grass-like isoform X2 n=1 Tax=Ochlerotatus camptorhynchus TaxID=644619 RepID=UPI0031CE0CB3
MSGESRPFRESLSCTTPNSIPGQCITVHRCRHILNMFKTQTMIPPAQQSFIRQSACHLPNVKYAVCCQLDEIERPAPDISLLPTECGITTADRVAGGDETGVFEFPWMALLRYRDFEGGIVDGCGGTLINDRYVLTAAHCLRVHTLTLDHVRLGEHNKKTEIDCEGFDGDCAGPVQDIKIEKLMIHPQYNKPKFSNDIGLIRLKSRAHFQDHIKPICLPVTSESQKMVFPKYILTGWGKTETNKLSDVLLKATVPRLDNEQCTQILQQQRLWISLNNKQMCAGGKNLMDSCRGDSGGPLGMVVKVGRYPRFIQYGIVSIGLDTCGIQNVPSVYTRVGEYMDWIQENLQPS